MQAIRVEKDGRTLRRVLRIKKEAEQNGEYRVARRLHAVALSMEGQTSTDIAQILDVHRNNVAIWLKNWIDLELEGALEGYRPGRPAELAKQDWEIFADIVDSGPIAYGLTSGVWTSPILVRVIEQEFGVAYSARHVRRLLGDLGFSVQRPCRKLARADEKKQNRWKRYTLPNLKKTPNQRVPRSCSETKPPSGKTPHSTKLGAGSAANRKSQRRAGGVPKKSSPR